MEYKRWHLYGNIFTWCFNLLYYYYLFYHLDLILLYIHVIWPITFWLYLLLQNTAIVIFPYPVKLLNLLSMSNLLSIGSLKRILYPFYDLNKKNVMSKNVLWLWKMQYNFSVNIHTVILIFATSQYAILGDISKAW